MECACNASTWKVRWQKDQKFEASFNFILSSRLVWLTEAVEKKRSHKKKGGGCGEMAQLLRALVALAEVLSSVSNTHIITHCNPSSKEIQPSSRLSRHLHIHIR